jgi:ribose 5-phosphate isomerase A
VVPFGVEATRRAIAGVCRRLGVPDDLRPRKKSDGAILVTDGGHFILDAHLGRIDRPEELAGALDAIPGVVEHGLFLSLATGAVLATETGLVELGQV